MSSLTLTHSISHPVINVRSLYILCFVVGLALPLITFSRSPGATFDDEMGHIVIAQQVWENPALVLNIWGRAANTLAYAVPALFGVDGARIGSIAMSMLTVLLTTAVASKIGIKHLFLIPLFFWFQPWVPNLTYQAITQIPLSLFMIAGIYLWLDGKVSWASILFGLLPLTRHEGIIMTGLWMLFMLSQRQWLAALLAWLPLLIYNIVYFVVLQVPFNEIPLIMYFRPNSTTEYGSGSWTHFIPSLFFGMGVPLLFWSLLSVRSVIRLRQKALLFVFYAAYFMIHTVIFRFGLYASGGYGLFIFPLAPACALLGALGVEYMLSGLRKASQRNHHRVQQVARGIFWIIVLIPVLVVGVQLQRPNNPNPTQRGLVQASEWLKTQQIPAAQVFSSHPWFYYYYPLPLPVVPLWTAIPPYDSLPAGSFIVWDKHYSDMSGAPLATLRAQGDWMQVESFENEAVIVFQKGVAQS